jgi:hypothetical protein
MLAERCSVAELKLLSCLKAHPTQSSHQNFCSSPCLPSRHLPLKQGKTRGKRFHKSSIFMSFPRNNSKKGAKGNVKNFSIRRANLEPAESFCLFDLVEWKITFFLSSSSSGVEISGRAVQARQT